MSHPAIVAVICLPGQAGLGGRPLAGLRPQNPGVDARTPAIRASARPGVSKRRRPTRLSAQRVLSGARTAKAQYGCIEELHRNCLRHPAPLTSRGISGLQCCRTRPGRSHCRNAA